MFLRKLSVCCALFAMVPATRVVSGNSPSTTTFLVKGYDNILYSELRCFARDFLLVRLTDGNVAQYDKDKEMTLRDSTGFATDPTSSVSADWSSGVRQVATARVEVLDDTTNRKFPNFTCVVYNEHKIGEEIRCGAASNGVVQETTTNPNICRVEVTDTSPRVNVIFKIHAWVHSTSGLRVPGVAFAPTLHCTSGNELAVEQPVEHDQTNGTNVITVLKGEELIPGGTALQRVPKTLPGTTRVPGTTNNIYDVTKSVILTNFNSKYDGFTCSLQNAATTLNCGSADSWDQKNKGQTWTPSCGVTIEPTQHQ